MSLYQKIFVCTFSLAGLTLATPANAQLGRIFGTVADKVAKEIVGSSSAKRDTSRGRSLEIDTGKGAFSPGTETIFQSDFDEVSNGSMPPNWQTNGTGAVATVSEFPGKWLVLEPFSTYKLSNGPELPERFTVEFDALIAADEAKDVQSFRFGFAHDNNVRRYMQDAYNHGAITAFTFNFRGHSNISSSQTDVYNATNLDLRSYANNVMHVAVEVDGDMMRVYLDGQKVADTQVFNGNGSKYFFISPATQTFNNSRVLFGNFRVAR